MIVEKGGNPLPSNKTTKKQDKPANVSESGGLATASEAVGSDSQGEYVKVQDGYVRVREMKDDNSCLFRSIGYVISHQADKHADLRREVADFVMKNPVDYCDAILGRPVSEYISWILKPESWYLQNNLKGWGDRIVYL